MADDERKALVVQGPRSLAEVGAGARKILSSVVSDALTVASSREKALTSTSFRIGSYEFREPDYSQVLIWAEVLEIGPEALVQQFEKICFDHWWFPKVVFAVEQGAIVSLAWDVVALPLKNFRWVTGLTIRDLAIFGKEAVYKNVLLQLPSLRLLIIKSVKLIKLDLSNVANLTELWCEDNKLTELDLCDMPNLTKLSCGDNNLTELDLSGLPELTTLWCYDNNLTELALSSVPNLTSLLCHQNQLTDLDLSKVPNLIGLWCYDNNLTELDLSSVPNLTSLLCHQNQLTDLDLSKVSNLTNLSCDENQLTEVDLSAVPNLTKLHCEKNLITDLDVTMNTSLTELHCDGSVRVVKLPSQNFKRHRPLRHFFDEPNNTLFSLAVPPPDMAGITEITQAEFDEYVAYVRAEEAKGIANDDE